MVWRNCGKAKCWHLLRVLLLLLLLLLLPAAAAPHAQVTPAIQAPPPLLGSPFAKELPGRRPVAAVRRSKLGFPRSCPCHGARWTPRGCQRHS